MMPLPGNGERMVVDQQGRNDQPVNCTLGWDCTRVPVALYRRSRRICGNKADDSAFGLNLRPHKSY